ncbi:gasdermin-E-like [Genypterus blacodes]|uniref:gasdermin-E-like n=1 Tax=Genypterus blacodes TaxID=154954 RepID=UPI003F76D662
MFSKATAKFVRQVDPEGCLIHVSRLNNSHKLVPMAVVAKRNRFWFWQRPKYQPTHFTLSDLLLGDKQLIPDVSESEFLSFEGKFWDTRSGKLNATAGSVEVNVEGKGSSKLQSSFGKLKKEGLNVNKLLHDSSNRLVDLQHAQVQQLQKRAEVLAVLKERIVTTSTCSITETRHKNLGCLGTMALTSVQVSQVSVTDRNNIDIDSDIAMEIPPGTVIAYSILELEIKKDGQYELCLHPGTLGGFETDSGTSSPSHDSFDGMDWSAERVGGKAPLQSALQNEWRELEVYLSPLAELPDSDRRTLFQKLLEILRDRAALGCLEDALEDWCRGEAAEAEELPLVQGNSVLAVLELLRSGPGEGDGFATPPARLTSAHLLVSSMEVLLDETLILLSDCSPEFLEAFDTLLFRFRESEQPLPLDSLPSILQGNKAFELAEQLLSSTNVMLTRDGDALRAVTGDKPGVFPLVLCVAVRGMSLLCNEQNK